MLNFFRGFVAVFSGPGIFETVFAVSSSSGGLFRGEKQKGFTSMNNGTSESFLQQSVSVSKNPSRLGSLSAHTKGVLEAAPCTKCSDGKELSGEILHLEDLQYGPLALGFVYDFEPSKQKEFEERFGLEVVVPCITTGVQGPSLWVYFQSQDVENKHGEHGVCERTCLCGSACRDLLKCIVSQTQCLCDRMRVSQTQCLCGSASGG